MPASAYGTVLVDVNDVLVRECDSVPKGKDDGVQMSKYDGVPQCQWASY